MTDPIAETIARVRELADEPSPVEFESVWLRLNEYVHLAPQLADEVERLRERVRVLEDALRPLATASMVSSVRPVYVIGARFGAPYDQRAAEAMVQAARAALEGSP